MGCKNCTPDENARINLNDYTNKRYLYFLIYINNI